MSDFTSAFYLMWLIGAMLAFLVFYYVCKGVLRFFARPSRLSSDSCYRVCVQGHHKDYGYNIYQNFYIDRPVSDEDAMMTCFDTLAQFGQLGDFENFQPISKYLCHVENSSFGFEIVSRGRVIMSASRRLEHDA